jgi:hypothetical protein
MKNFRIGKFQYLLRLSLSKIKFLTIFTELPMGSLFTKEQSGAYINKIDQISNGQVSEDTLRLIQINTECIT